MSSPAGERFKMEKLNASEDAASQKSESDGQPLPTSEHQHNGPQTPTSVSEQDGLCTSISGSEHDSAHTRSEHGGPYRPTSRSEHDGPHRPSLRSEHDGPRRPTSKSEHESPHTLRSRSGHDSPRTPMSRSEPDRVHRLSARSDSDRTPTSESEHDGLPTPKSRSENDGLPSPRSLSEKTGVSTPSISKHTDSLRRLMEENEEQDKDETPTWSESDREGLLPVGGTSSYASQVGTPVTEHLSGVSIVTDLRQLQNDDEFHATTQTVIIPAAAASSVPRGSPSSHRGRFVVSPAQGIPGSLHRRISGAHTHGRVSRQQSTSTVTRASSPTSPVEDLTDIQFKMSDLSLPKTDQKDVEQPLLDKQSSEDNVKFAALNHWALDFAATAADRRDTEPMVPLMEGIEDDAFEEVEESQATIQSVGGFSVDTQDSLTFEKSPFQCGNIKFVRDAYDSQGYQPKKHYVCIPAETSPDQVTYFMSRFWGLRNPKIVLSVISDIESFKPWKNQRLKDDFEKGIIKAANTTNMWILTNGIDGGIAKLIGDAVRQEKIQQINAQVMNNPVLTGSEQRRKRLTVIGIVPKDTVAYGVYFDGTDGVQIKNVGQKPSTDIDIYELNPDHTHFVMVEDDGKDTQFSGMRFAVEKQLQIKSGPSRRIRLMSIDGGYGAQIQKIDTPENTIPVVGLLVQGSPRNIDHILLYMQNKMPIVVLKGSGGIADIIAYAYDEFMERGDDSDYQENFLKPELIKLLVKQYASKFEENDPTKFTLRDKIIECARLATEASGDQAIMTVVNIKGWGSSLKDLDKFILMALFKAGKREGGPGREPLQSDLQLAVDWNRPDLAAQIFQQDFAKVRVDKAMFEQSLLKKDREQLIELFLSQGIRIHKFLNHKKLKLLFEKAEDREFFLNVCMEQVLGLFMFPDQQLDAAFLSEHLNRLIYKLTGITRFIQPYELSMNSTGMYIIDPIVAERRALNTLIIWAVLMNRHKLARTLWTKSDQPVVVALICSMVYRSLSKYNMEQFQKTEMDDHASEFGEMGLGILDICWQDNSIMAYSILSKRYDDFNNKTLIEIAYNAGYIHFLAHPCCQKWLTKAFFGNLQFKELDWGLFRLPYWFKILTSAFLIFPIYFWITFIPPKKKKTISDEGMEEDQEADEDENSDDDDYGEPPLTKSAFDMALSKKKVSLPRRILRTTFSFPTTRKEVPFWTKIYLLWTAPITKFWTSQTFYFIYLAVFCFATLWPTCGNIYLDIVLWLWTSVILLELVCRVYMKYHRYKTLSLVTNCIEIILITLFLVALLVMRILPNWVFLTNYIHSKTVLCYGLIYFFYRLLGIYLLISPTLGPMLLRITRMIKHDFLAFIRMFLIFMIAGGVTIQAVLYPNWPINVEMIKRVLTRPIYGMFLTQIDDLEGTPACKQIYDNSSGYCAAQGVDATGLQKCPYSSFSGYIITLQYLLICKLVLVTLLFAMFALTIAKVDNQASVIWKFQRYALIADVQERFSLPPPFTIFGILFLLLRMLFRKLRLLARKCLRCSSCCTPRKPGLSSQKSRIRKAAQDDSSFWRQCTREYIANAQTKKDKEEVAVKHEDILLSLTEDLKANRKSLKHLNDRVVELERMVQSSRLYLEDISHKLDKTDVMGITDVKGQFIHVAARQSPYPGTNITRFPVFDKYVPWEISYDVYDPKTYTLPRENFPESELPCVDEDLIQIFRVTEEHAAPEDSRGLPPLHEEPAELPRLPLFKPKWNAVVTYKLKGIRREVDRRSWIAKDNQPLRYNLDPLRIPVNPMGRTGIRGKGVLWRWGPNHVIKAVITRWRRKYTADFLPTASFLYVEGKRVLEFITVPKNEFSEGLSEVNYGLPGEALHGDSNTYNILCKAFMSYVIEQPESEHGQREQTQKIDRFDQSDMIQYFAQFSTNMFGFQSTSVSSLPHSEGGLSRSVSRTFYPRWSESQAVRGEMDQQGFSATLLYKGYLDDPRNTDNAWVEAEVWNFHYDFGDDFDMRLKPDLGAKWKEVSPYVKMFGNESVIVQEAAKIHDAYH